MAIETLMDVHDVSEETAFAMLRVTSDHLNRRLRDIADDVARTGRLPTRDSSNE
jgi:AmiR/NasT family two-component response regulator